MTAVVSASERDQSFGRLEIMHMAISCPIEFHGTLISGHFNVRKADTFNKKILLRHSNASSSQLSSTPL